MTEPRTRLRLSPKQEQSIGQATSRISVWEGAVRSGKTISSLLRWLMYVANAPRGGQLVVSGKTTDTIARNVFGPLMDPAITGHAAKLISYTRGAPTGKVLGRSIEVISANDARSEGRLRGLTCAGAYVDEATLVPEEFWTQLIARLSVPGAQLFATTNPGPPTHWLRKNYLLRAAETQTRSWHFAIEDNPHLDPGYVAWLKSTYTGLWYRRFVLGHWVMAEGAVYDGWDEDSHVVDVLPEIADWIAVGIDYGTSNPFAALVLALGVDGRLYLTNEWRHDSRASRRSLTDVEYSERLRGWLGGIPHPHIAGVQGLTPRWMTVDPSAASFMQQLHRDHLNPIPADNAVLDGIRMVASLLGAGQLLVHRSCKGWIEEIGGYSWDPARQLKGEDSPIKADDHSLDAGRYAIKTTESDWRWQIQAA